MHLTIKSTFFRWPEQNCYSSKETARRSIKERDAAVCIRKWRKFIAIAGSSTYIAAVDNVFAVFKASTLTNHTYVEYISVAYNIRPATSRCVARHVQQKKTISDTALCAALTLNPQWRKSQNIWECKAKKPGYFITSIQGRSGYCLSSE